jgi:predicted nucleic acid-binding protein
MTVAELERWTLERNWGRARREELYRFLDPLTTVFVNRALCRTWAEVTDQARRRGRPIQTADAWIAATALSLDEPLVTHNRTDFEMVDGLRFLPEAPP